MPEWLARKRRWARQIALSVRVLGGGFWTSDGIPNSGVTDGTTMSGLGVRILKGMHHNYAFEAEFLGARTGEAEFPGSDWQGLSGDIFRQATIGRLQASGVVRFGDRYVTSVRLGVGIQGTSYRSRFTSGGQGMTGPGDGVEIDGGWSVGAAFDARLGEHWLLGAGASGVFYTGARSLDVALQVGYRWDSGASTL